TRWGIAYRVTPFVVRRDGRHDAPSMEIPPVGDRAGCPRSYCAGGSYTIFGTAGVGCVSGRSLTNAEGDCAPHSLRGGAPVPAVDGAAARDRLRCVAGGRRGADGAGGGFD